MTKQKDQKPSKYFQNMITNICLTGIISYVWCPPHVSRSATRRAGRFREASRGGRHPWRAMWPASASAATSRGGWATLPQPRRLQERVGQKAGNGKNKDPVIEHQQQQITKMDQLMATLAHPRPKQILIWMQFFFCFFV